MSLVFVVMPASPASADVYEAEWLGRGIQYDFDSNLCPSHAIWTGNFTTEELGKMRVTALVPLCDPSSADDAWIRVTGAGGAMTAEYSGPWDTENGNGAVYTPVSGSGRFAGIRSQSTISIDRDLSDLEWPTEPVEAWAKPGHGQIRLDLVFAD